MTTLSAVVAAVVAENTSDVFALMGNGNAYFTDALAQNRHVTMTAVRHETATVASADAFWRVARKIAVATTTFGPGYTNALTALAEAAVSRSPLVFVVGGEPSTGPRPWDVDQVAMAEAVGALTMTIGQNDAPQAAEIAEGTKQAFQRALEDRLPVVLFVPFDKAKLEVTGDFDPQQYRVETQQQLVRKQKSPELSGDQAATIAKKLEDAQRPLILAGRGARFAAKELGELADNVGALTAATAPARGIFADRPWDLGVSGGFASERSSELMNAADVVLVVGASLNQFTTAFNTQFGTEATVIQIDLETEATNPRVDVFASADAQLAAAQINQKISRKVAEGQRWGGVADDAESSTLNFARPVGDGTAEDGRLDPRSVMHELNTILPKNRQIISDGGHFIGWTSYHFDLPSTDSMTLIGTHFQAIGLGFPSAPGAIRGRKALGQEPMSVVVTGDGGGIMALADLDSVVRTATSAIVLVFNDACYGAEIHQYGSQGLDEEIMEIDEVNFAKIAEGFGAKGLVIQTLDDLQHVQEWVNSGAKGTVVADLRISRKVVAPYIEEIVEHTLKKK